jgi:hypothetical protein
MRPRQFALSAALALIALPAFAQTAPVGDPASGIRPGHIVGVGASEPSSARASNINQSDTKSMIAPTLPAPDVGMDATPFEYLRSARASLVAGRTGQAQQALEMAETRVLGRVVPPGQTTGPMDSQFVSQIRDARRSLAEGDSPGAIAKIDRALAG